MTRKQFMKSQGATCRNWNWSWSFVNPNKKIVFFGAWDKHTNGSAALILDEAWERSYKGKVNPGYREAREYIRLIEEEHYTLKTFPQIYSTERQDDQGVGPAKLKGISPVLTEKVLRKVGGKWYASEGIVLNILPEEVDQPELYIEGASKIVSVNAYERNSKARQACIKHYGPICIVCEFNFEVKYGDIGSGIIHVHHLVPLSDIKRQYQLDPIKDLRPVCPNCHAVIHSTQPALSIEDLKKHVLTAVPRSRQ